VTRYVNGTNQTEGDKTRVGLFIACALDFSSGFIRAHDGLGTINFSSNDYLGVGKFGGIAAVEESIDVIARPVTLTLSGVDSGLVSTATTETYQGRTATLYMGFVDLDSNAVIATPETLWEGRMNQMSISMNKGGGSITLSCEHRLRNVPRIGRYTDADEKLAYSGDRFFDLVPKIQGFRGTWGAKGVANDGRKIVAPTTPRRPGR
jgi:hypothetical protein